MNLAKLILLSILTVLSFGKDGKAMRLLNSGFVQHLDYRDIRGLGLTDSSTHGIRVPLPLHKRTGYKNHGMGTDKALYDISYASLPSKGCTEGITIKCPIYREVHHTSHMSCYADEDADKSEIFLTEINPQRGAYPQETAVFSIKGDSFRKKCPLHDPPQCRGVPRTLCMA